MFSVMRAQLRLIEVVGSSKPRLRSGAMTESAEAKTSETKTTPASLCTVSATSSGFWMTEMMSGTKDLMSRLSMTPQTSSIALAAASLTLGLVSHMREERTGMMSLSARFTCFLNFSAMSESRLTRSRLACHLLAPSFRTAGRTAATASGAMPLMSSVARPSASMVTCFALSADASMIVGSIGTRYGAEAVGDEARRARRPAKVLARAFAPCLPESASSLVTSLKRPCLLALTTSVTADANVMAALALSSAASTALSVTRGSKGMTE
mmetsp:Transcript_13537/g.29305  ORF Transcript_13537/g.29305 Transcript_13537/m.29305 type:complete len:267 (+) Transcript_13537:450-1250(+)